MAIEPAVAASAVDNSSRRLATCAGDSSKRAAPETSDTLKESSEGVAAVRLDLRVAAVAGVVLEPIAVSGELAPKTALCDSSASLTPCEKVEETNCGARVAKPAIMEWLEATELAASPGVAAGAAGLRAPLRMELWSREAEKSTPSARNSSTDEASMPAVEVGAPARSSLKARVPLGHRRFRMTVVNRRLCQIWAQVSRERTAAAA